MKLFQIRVDIYEPGDKFPIVVHLFQGTSPDHAERIHQAHKKSDAFLRDCEGSGLFAKRVPCRAVVTRGWVTIR